MITYAEIEDFLGSGLAPLFGNDPLLAGMLIVLLFATAMAIWNIPMIISTIIMIGVVLVISLYANLFPINIGFMGIAILCYFFIMMVMKILNER